MPDPSLDICVWQGANGWNWTLRRSGKDLASGREFLPSPFDAFKGGLLTYFDHTIPETAA
jgi:hypothetical protein